MLKTVELINFLLQQDKPVTSSTIQKFLGVSRRSIINYVKYINSTNNNIIASNKDGYYLLDKQQAKEFFIEEEDYKQFENYEKRKRYILEQLLLNNNDLSIETLSNTLYVSDITINKDLVKLRKELKEKDLYINNKNNHLYIVGEIKKQHKYLLELLNAELEDSMFSLTSLQDFFEIVDIQSLKQIIINVLSEYNYNLDDYSLLNYVLHIAICIETSADGYSNTSNNNSYDFSTHLEKIIYELFRRLKVEYPDINFTINQLFDISILMSTRVVSSKVSNLSLDDIAGIVGDEIKNVLTNIIEQIYTNYGINLNNEDFIVRFAIHIKNMVARCRNKVKIPSNSFFTIKQDYPYFYMIASNIASIISNNLDIEVEENEIIYIALHLGVLMESKKDNLEKIKCIIITHDYYNIGKFIFDKLNKYIPNLYLENVYSNYEEINTKSDIDLVITTLDINPLLTYQQIKINTLPTEKDIDNVKKRVDVIQSSLAKKQLTRNLQRLFNSDLFFIDKPLKNIYHAIEFMCNKLEEDEFVKPEFRNDILSHEYNVPTEYGNIAIPHPLTSSGTNVNRSVIAVWISKKPITWINNKINFIFMIALKPEDKPLFSEVFNTVISLLTDTNKIDKLYECKTFSNFIDNLLSTNDQ